MLTIRELAYAVQDADEQTVIVPFKGNGEKIKPSIMHDSIYDYEVTRARHTIQKNPWTIIVNANDPELEDVIIDFIKRNKDTIKNNIDKTFGLRIEGNEIGLSEITSKQHKEKPELDLYKNLEYTPSPKIKEPPKIYQPPEDPGLSLPIDWNPGPDGGSYDPPEPKYPPDYIGPEEPEYPPDYIGPDYPGPEYPPDYIGPDYPGPEYPPDYIGPDYPGPEYPGDDLPGYNPPDDLPNDDVIIQTQEKDDIDKQEEPNDKTSPKTEKKSEDNNTKKEDDEEKNTRDTSPIYGPSKSPEPSETKHNEPELNF